MGNLVGVVVVTVFDDGRGSDDVVGGGFGTCGLEGDP